MRVECPSCKQPLTVSDDTAGKAFRCPRCQNLFKTPSAGPTSPVPLAAPLRKFPWILPAVLLPIFLVLVLTALISLRGCSPSSLEDASAGPASIRVVRASIEYPMYFNMFGRQCVSENPGVLVFVSIANNSENQKVDFTSWTEEGYGVLRDEHGNRYSLMTFGRSAKVYWFEKKIIDLNPIEQTIEPGKQITVAVPFQKPIASAEHFTIELSKSNLGQTGNFHLTFDRTIFKKTR